MKNKLLITGLLVHCVLFVWAQKPCATAEPSETQRRFLHENIFQQAAQEGYARNAGTTCVPIRLYIFREDDGSGGLGEEAMALGLSFLNSVYQVAGIEFYFASRAYFNDSDAYHFDTRAPDNDDENDLTSTAGESNDAINMYVVNEIFLSGGFQAAGYAYLPYADFNLYNRIVMADPFFSQLPHGTLSHELGHYFGLLHTHSFTQNGNMDPDAEAVPRTGGQADCGGMDGDGDMLCQTEADPSPNTNNMMGCTYTGDDGMSGIETDEYGNAYTPPQNNIMSYYSGFCQNQIFVGEQYAVIQQGLATRQGFNTNSLDAAPMTVAVPTNVMANLNTNETDIVLTWQDVANNEFGYVIERSTTSSMTGFSPITYGAVASDVTTYLDNNIAENTTYYYRIKPINGGCNTYSATASYSVGELYCAASITQCDEYIERVVVGTIDNDSSADGCTNGQGFARYVQSTDMERSGTYALQAFTNNTFNGDELGVWIDWNQNGELGDMGEFYNLGGPSGVNTFTGDIIVPANAILGNTRMRIRLSYTIEDALAPCGNQVYGEVEDYTVNVLVDPLPVSWHYVRASAQEEGIHIDWATSLEQDNDFFAIERLAANQEWQEIGRMTGRNGEGETYRYLDKSPLTGNNFYRLRQVDFSGEFDYSEVVNAVWKGGALVAVYPNPVYANLHIQFSEESQYQIRLMNAMGKVVLDRKNLQDRNTMMLDMSTLPEVCYFLTVAQEDGQLIHREQVILVR